MPDFTIVTYKKLIETLLDFEYRTQTFFDYLNSSHEKVVILRHDIDARKQQALRFARIQSDLEVRGTYYFRMVPQSYDERIIREIHALGHETGYHYEDMDFANGDHDKAIKLFEKHLGKLREIATVETICMHGSPLSKYDNRNLWKHFDYRDYGIVAEPYFDLDFSKVLYLTDTGRRWDGDKVSVRDRSSDGTFNKQMEGKKPLSNQYSFHTTFDIIKACRAGSLPDQIMFNFHPQRWTNNPVLWSQEFVFQNIKNVVKWGLNKINSN